MSRRRRSEESSESAGEWLLTYSDLVTLLLTFFVLLFSMAVIDKQKFEEVANSLRSTFLRTSSGDTFNFNKGEELISITQQNNVDNEGESEVNDDPRKSEGQEQQSEEERKAEEIKAQKLQDVKKQVQQAIVKLDLENFVTIIEEKHSLILRLDSVILFDLGSADIKPSGKEILTKIGSILKELDHEIMIQGHTDNLPINTLLFPTNWELSTKRATNVVLHLIDSCNLEPSKLTATGNGEFRPIRPNDTEENRQKNRRIDIVIDK